VIEHGTVVGNAAGIKLRPCGACNELVILCGHIAGGGAWRRQTAEPPPSHDRIKADVIERAAGQCETCGAEGVELFPRVVNQHLNGGSLSRANGLATCAGCRAVAWGKTIASWVATGTAPPQAVAYVAERQRLGLRV
jgi:hypothetical protein